jgi:hypothetical protein
LIRPVGLVACCKTKLLDRAAARDLYAGTLFRLSVQWMVPRCSEWAILSAKHGVLLPHQVIEPYEQTLVGATWNAVQGWHRRTNQQLRELFPDRRFLVIAGHEYLGAVVGLEFEQAFGGLPIGRKMQAIKAAISRGAEVKS